MRRKNMKKTAALFLLSVGINCMTVQDIVPVYEFDIDVQNVGAPINQLCMESSSRISISGQMEDCMRN